MWAHLIRRPYHLAVLVLCAMLVTLGQWLRWDWFIDDAAICFAYARNIANGEGIVPWPGAERIEGFSDPTWMVVLTLFQWVGLDGFVVAKPLALLFSLLTLPVVYSTARLALRDGDDSFSSEVAPLFAPVAFALNAQVAIWSASGLENALWSLLLAISVHLTVLDGRTGRFGRSAFCWLLVAWSRPEGFGYALCGVFWWLVMIVRDGRDIRKLLLGWMAVFWGPTLVLELMRLWYFGWPLPNTWYAKVQTRPGHLFLFWNERGWFQVREYMQRLWHGWYLPVYAIGLLGLGANRIPASLDVPESAPHPGSSTSVRERILWTTMASVLLLMLFPSPEPLANLSFWPDALKPTPDAFAPDWLTARMLALVAVAVLLPFAAVNTAPRLPGWEVRVLCWHCCAIALLFSVYANGDWMGAYRWMSLMAPCQAVLLACGLRELIEWLEYRVSGQREWRSMGWLAASFGILLLLPPNLHQLRDHIRFNKNETPSMVKLRADYTASVARRTFYEGTVLNLEMDQGAHLWWRPEYVEIDMAGLVDIPMSRHRYSQRRFIEDYVFTENPPTFGHVHMGWARMSGFKTYSRWSEMVELPPYRDEPGLPPHDGVWARRTLFAFPAWKGPKRKVLFEDGLVLHGFDVPGEIWGQGDNGFIEVGISSRAREKSEVVRVLAFLTDGTRVVSSWELPLGYGGLFPMHQWREDEVFIGRFALPIREDIPVGWYDLGLVALSASGQVLAARADPTDRGPSCVFAGPGGETPVMANGEVRFLRAIKVTSRDDLVARAEAVGDQVLVDAVAGHCESAEELWIRAKRVRPTARRWQAAMLGSDEQPGIKRAMADCWARRAERDPSTAARSLARSHRWDHHSEELARVGAVVGQQLWEEGKAARAREDWEAAYDAFAALLKFQPWRSWARVYAEEARDHRLGLHEPPREDGDADGDPTFQ